MYQSLSMGQETTEPGFFPPNRTEPNLKNLFTEPNRTEFRLPNRTEPHQSKALLGMADTNKFC